MRYFSLRQQVLLFLLALAIVASLFLQIRDRPSRRFPEGIGRETVVEVTGEVDHPGIYLFRTPPTLKEAVEKSGALRGAVFVNKESFEILETGTRLTVAKEPKRAFPGERGQDLVRIKIGRMEARQLLVFSIPLDLNRVSEQDLCLVPGIGKTLAHEIVSYRKDRRGFRSVLELKEVKGINEKRWKELAVFFKCDES